MVSRPQCSTSLAGNARDMTAEGRRAQRRARKPKCGRRLTRPAKLLIVVKGRELHLALQLDELAGQVVGKTM